MNGNRGLQMLGALCIVAGLIGLFMVYDPAGQQRAAVRGEPAQPRMACRVLTVYDGDTIGCDLNGNGRLEAPVEQVRFLGIDTPEMHYSKKNRLHSAEDEPFAKAASRWLQKQLDEKTVYLERDQRPRDGYGRTLAHVYRTENGRVSVGEELLRLGYATVLFYEPNRRYQQRFLEAEHEARMHGRGLWGHWVEDVAD